MAFDKLQIYEEPKFGNPRLLIGLSGWMDGGDVSTGTIEYLVDHFDAEHLAEIGPEGFYLYNFPGSMEVSALFRPYTRIKNGMVTSYSEPANIFYYDRKNELIMLLGQEPNMNWNDYVDCIFSVCERFGVKMIYFIGSVAGLLPHTRQPRIFCSVSHSRLKKTMVRFGMNLSNYEGPASIITYLTTNSKEADIGMVSIVAEIPAYLQGRNPSCINAMIKRLSAVLELRIDHNDLRTSGDKFERKVNRIVKSQPKLAEHIKKLEENYDNEIFDTQMGDLKDWLEQQGIEVD